MTDLTFKTDRKKPGVRYLRFLPRSLRPLGLKLLLINLASILVAAIFYPSLQQEIPLFYSLSSDQQLAQKEFLFILPALATVLNLIHLSIARLEKELNYNILKMFLQITLVLQLLTFAILLRIIIIIH